MFWGCVVTLLCIMLPNKVRRFGGRGEGGGARRDVDASSSLALSAQLSVIFKVKIACCIVSVPMCSKSSSDLKGSRLSNITGITKTAIQTEQQPSARNAYNSWYSNSLVRKQYVMVTVWYGNSMCY